MGESLWPSGTTDLFQRAYAYLMILLKNIVGNIYRKMDRVAYINHAVSIL